jgi:hypothetical protein
MLAWDLIDAINSKKFAQAHKPHEILKVWGSKVRIKKVNCSELAISGSNF